jgi:hypothetical protein
VKSLRNLLLTLVVLAPAKLLACAACYGANIDAPMADGMNWAILTLGVVITTVLAGFLTFLIYAIRKSEAVEAGRVAATQNLKLNTQSS